MLSGTYGALVPSRQAVWLRIEEWKRIDQNFSFSSDFISTILLSFLSYSLFLLQQTQLRAIVVKCDGSVYEVDVDVPTGSDSDPNPSNGFNNINAS